MGTEPPLSIPAREWHGLEVQTLLSRFCEDLSTRMRPLTGPLEEVAALLDRPEGAPLADLVPPVADYRRRLRSLLEKLEEQQSYVILFGPLKSGKSTLMNAFAEAWVSEVTALPAYPCMVYVAHEESSRFTVTRYDGSKESFESLAAMREVMSRAHADLAAGIRAVEALNGRYSFPDDVRLMDGGTQGIFLLPWVCSARRLLILDAVDFGMEPASLRMVKGEDVPRFMGAKKVSMHQR